MKARIPCRLQSVKGLFLNDYFYGFSKSVQSVRSPIVSRHPVEWVYQGGAKLEMVLRCRTTIHPSILEVSGNL